MSGLADLNPDELAGLELAMLQARADTQGVAADIATPWRIDNKDQMNPEAPPQEIDFPLVPFPDTSYKVVIRTRLPKTNWRQAYDRKAQDRRDSWTIAGCIALLLLLALGAWLW